jgi:all-trans-8'-apo-beta-carotenal 15,15'-oxygenase
MVTSLQRSPAPAWVKGILQPGIEFDRAELTVLSGEIPTGLRGALYRNGPGLLSRNGQPVGHWFDGDGAVLAVYFEEGTARGGYRYVQTAGYQQETAAGEYQLAGYGMLPPGSFWQRLTQPLKNAANTSVLALPDKLLALWEGGEPYGLDLRTLETIGLEDLGALAGRNYSAHPKRDRETGEIFNFGVIAGANSSLHVYCSDRSGRIRREGRLALKGVPLVHDFVLAGRYLVFCVPPVRVQVLPVLARLKSFGEAIAWQPHLGSEIIVVDRDTLQEVCRMQTEAWYQWHFGNGWELANGSISLTIARYEDFQTNQRLREIVSGNLHTAAIATLWQLEIDPQRGKVISMEKLLDRSCEFPVNQPQDVGRAPRYTYLSIHRQATDSRTELFDAIARFDHQTGTLTEANLGDAHYPTEPIYAPGAEQADLGWVLTVVYNAEAQRSEVWIFASDRLDDAPVCRVALPAIVPIGFHGTWQEKC